MTRHILLTSAIVAVVYTGLLWVNSSQLSSERVTWDDFLQYMESSTPH